MAGIVEKLVRRARALGADFTLGEDGKVLVRGFSSLPEELQSTLRDNKPGVSAYLVQESKKVAPIIWREGNVHQIRSLLVLREAELVAAKAQLTGNERADWYANNV
ncbi:MAG: hypothetical protein SVY53_03820, partial [Chloroflexota bacterium]|nr:hypothetical protein [Chloroflexota bacterium]